MVPFYHHMYGYFFLHGRLCRHHLLEDAHAKKNVRCQSNSLDFQVHYQTEFDS